jgi:hypothetical protein
LFFHFTFPECLLFEADLLGELLLPALAPFAFLFNISMILTGSLMQPSTQACKEPRPVATAGSFITSNALTTSSKATLAQMALGCMMTECAHTTAASKSACLNEQ